MRTESANAHDGPSTSGQSESTARRWLTEGRGVWLALILVPIFAWAGLLLTVYTAVPPCASTGDPLLDKCVATIAASAAVPTGTQWGYDYGLGGIRDEVLADWEDDFGDDPRYWMLKYHLTSETSTTTTGGGEHDRNAYLEEARRRGVVDGALLLRLLREYDSAWWSEAQEHFRVLAPQQQGQSKAPYMRAVRAEIDERHGAEHKLLLAELLTAAPDEALPHYYSAMYEAERGSYATAVSELRKGNSAASNSTLTGFPFDELMHGIRTGQPLEDKAVSGKLCGHSVYLALPSFIRIKDMAKVLVADAIERQDLAALDALHSFGCRYGSAEGASMMRALVGCVLIILPLKAVRDDWPASLDAEQRTALAELEVKKDQLRAELRAISNQSAPYLYGQLPPSQYWLQYAESLLTGGRALALLNLELMHNNTMQEQQALAGKVKQLVDEIETFDYTTLSWEQ